MKPPDEGRGGSPSGEDAAAMEPGWDGGKEGAVSYKSRVSEGAGLRDVPPDTQPQVTAQKPCISHKGAKLIFPWTHRSFQSSY